MCNFRLIFLTKSAHSHPNAFLCNHSHFHEFRSPLSTSFTFCASFSWSRTTLQPCDVSPQNTCFDALTNSVVTILHTQVRLQRWIKLKSSDQHARLSYWQLQRMRKLLLMCQTTGPAEAIGFCQTHLLFGRLIAEELNNGWTISQSQGQAMGWCLLSPPKVPPSVWWSGEFCIICRISIQVDQTRSPPSHFFSLLVIISHEWLNGSYNTKCWFATALLWSGKTVYTALPSSSTTEWPLESH